jgi:hypothetical protein
MNPSPAKILAMADELFDARRARRPSAFSGEIAVGEIPLSEGRVLTLARSSRAEGITLFRVRIWNVTPNGGRIPLTYGFNFTAKVLPVFAGLVARALQLELDELPEWARQPAAEQEPSGHDDRSPDVACSTPTTSSSE